MILIKGGRLIDPRSGTDESLDIIIEGRKIKSIGKFSTANNYDRIINAGGRIVAPGLIDVHVHFRDPGFTYKEDLSSGTAAAIRGGYTSVVCMANTKPAIDNCDTLKDILDRASNSPIHIHTVAAVSKNLDGKELTDIRALKDLGAVGLSDDGIPLKSTAFLKKAMLAAKEHDLTISLHEEDPELIGTAGINHGRISEKLGLLGAPSASESSMVARDCMLALDTGAKLHMQHVSTAESVAAIRLAKQLGANVTAEVTPQHLVLTEDAVLTKGTLAKLNPPLRTEDDRLALIDALNDGTIDMIATDHAPHSDSEKAHPFPEAPSGVTGLETALAVCVTHLVRNGYLSLPKLIEKMTHSPAALYALDAGYLAEGGNADIIIFDDSEKWTVTDFASKSANSPFINENLYGRIKYTICSGKILYRDS